ncbi:uncharacterized protein [Typha latifolia]|uniref:uncharacterized protein isoform X2 n=1 Tax=Typha latifolia TaxID=4733 RepID=UPI003C2ECAFC
MESEIDVNAELNYATFQLSPVLNRYEAVICSKGITEKLASGSLDQLQLHLQEAERFRSSLSSEVFKLQPGKILKGSSWFTKSTLALFLRIVNSPEALNSVSATVNEIFQLEETHLALSSKVLADHSSSGVTGVFLKEEGSTEQMKIETVTSDATKNELLRALDLRLMALKEEMIASFNQVASSNFSTKQISDLVAFSEHFGAVDLRNSLEKYLSIISNGPIAEPSVEPLMVSHDSNEMSEKMSEPWSGTTNPASNGVSPAKLAQVERQSSSESEESSEVSDEDQIVAERSRPAIRSASPRRSASPMRRVQIGRSGSRRSTTLTIKSLNYFPSRERNSLNRGADESNSGDEESDQPLKKPDTAARMMSVQDAINLFESKQKDKNIMDTEKKRGSGDVSSTTNKSVLRRWSAGTHNYVTHQSQEITSDTPPQSTPTILVPEIEEKKLVEVKDTSNVLACSFATPEVGASQANTLGGMLSEVESMASLTSSSLSNPMELMKPQLEEISSQATVSAERNCQKESEINQRLIKNLENKPGKAKSTKAGSNGLEDTSNELKGVSNSRHKKKMNEKLPADNAEKRTAKKSQFMVLQGALEQSKEETVSKIGAVKGKHISPVHSQRPRRNSAPPILPKEVLKPTVSKKVSPRSTAPATHNALSSGPLPKTSGTQITRSSPKMVLSDILPSRQKVQSASSYTKPSPNTWRPLEQQKAKKGTITDSKPAIKGQEEKKLKAATKNNRSVKTKATPALGDDFGFTAKPTYSKVTQKSSVVPPESKPFLRKGTRIGSGVVPVLAKTKVSQANVSPEESRDLIRNADKESSPTESISKEVEVCDAQPVSQGDSNLETSIDNGLNIDKKESMDQSLAAPNSFISNSLELPTVEFQPDEDMGISSAAWVEVENEEALTWCEKNLLNNAVSPVLVPMLSSSPCIDHSLSQVLQTDSNEPEIIEWGNAENPPALIYQKDAPKGLKRLLKFARKNKGEASVTGWSSPSVFSEGEDDLEESKGANRYSDSLLRKSALQAKVYSHQKTMLSESFDCGNSSKRTPEYHRVNDILSGQSNNSILKLEKLREGHASVAATSTKGSRSFFSLSTFRSSKSNDTKPQ